MDLFTAALSLSMAATMPAETAPIRITSAGTAASAAGPADYFTGRVRIDAPFQTDAPARVGGATVTFEPGKGVLGSHLLVNAVVPGISEEEFHRIAEDAKVNCPISQALASIPITLEAELA